MVTIVKDFNEDMDNYISKLRSQQPKWEAPKKKEKEKKTFMKVPEINEEEIYVEYDEPSALSKWFSNIFGPRRRIPSEKDIPIEDLSEEEVGELEELETEIEEIDEDDDIDGRRESLVSRFLSRMRLARRKSQSPSRDELLDEMVPVMDEDVKEVLKIMHKWLERLPSQDLKQFKVSNDFVKYKAILEKYGLIKKN